MPGLPLEPGASDIIEALRGATRSRHAMVASLPAMLRLFAADYGISEYRTHLGRLLGIFEPLECAVAKAAVPEDLACGLHRSRDLREDLLVMGATEIDLAALERCPRPPPIPTAGLGGYTYVVLGSMLGGRIIVKQLRTVLGPAASFRFYGGGNIRYELSWASFCSDLEKNRRNDVAAICATAVGIFDAYAAWLSEPLLRDGSR